MVPYIPNNFSFVIFVACSIIELQSYQKWSLLPLHVWVWPEQLNLHAPFLYRTVGPLLVIAEKWKKYRSFATHQAFMVKLWYPYYRKIGLIKIQLGDGQKNYSMLGTDLHIHGSILEKKGSLIAPDGAVIQLSWRAISPDKKKGWKQCRTWEEAIFKITPLSTKGPFWRGEPFLFLSQNGFLFTWEAIFYLFASKRFLIKDQNRVKIMPPSRGTLSCN